MHAVSGEPAWLANETGATSQAVVRSALAAARIGRAGGRRPEERSAFGVRDAGKQPTLDVHLAPNMLVFQTPRDPQGQGRDDPVR